MNTPTPEHLSAAKLALEKIGGPQKMADALTRLSGQKVSVWSVRRWRDSGVPARWVLWVEYLTGIGPERTRPDMSPKANLPEARA